MKVKINLSKILLYSSLFILGFNYILYNALGYDDYKLILRFISIFLAFTYFIVFKKAKILKLQIFLIIYCLIQLFTGNIEALNFLTIIFLTCILENNIDKSSRDIFNVYTILILILILLLLTGVIKNRYYLGFKGRQRATLGFTNPNAGSLFYVTYLYFLILIKKDISKLYIFFVFLINLLIFNFTDSRTTFLAFTLFILFMLAHNLFKNKKSVSKLIGMSNIVIINLCFLFSLISILIVDKLFILDEFLSFRITRLQNELLEVKLINYFFGGFNIKVDNLYYILLLSFGVIFYVVIWYLANKSCFKLYKNKSWKYLAFLTSTLVMGLTESSVYRIEVIGFILVWKLILSSTNRSELNGK